MTKYILSERLGSGPTCDVFLGRDVGGLNRKVAVKQLREDVRSHSTRREAFFSAAQKWSQFEHPGLVTLFDLDRIEGSVIYEPHPLSGKQVIAAGAKSPQQLAELLSQVATALGYIHGQQMLHLNLKPTNILFDNSGRAKLIDGRCSQRDRIGELPSPSGGQKYLAPELIDPSIGPIGPQTDIYCLGFVMFEMLLGPTFDDLFRGVGSNAEDADRNWLRWHSDRNEPLPALQERIPELPHALERVLHRMLNKNPLQRFHTVVELLDELRAVQGVGVPSDESHAAPPRAAENSSAIANSAKMAPPAPVGKGEEPKVDDIPNRPTAPVVIRFLGCEAEMVGVNKDFFTIGDTAECDIKFPAGLRRSEATVFRIGRAAEGWRLNSSGEMTYYINQEVATASTNLRSGDVIRMFPGGPGMQFTILNQNAVPLSKIATQFAPRLMQPSADAASAKPVPPSLIATNNNHVRAPVAPSVPVNRSAPTAPVKAAASAPAPPARATSAPSRPESTKAPPSQSSQRFSRMLDYKSWDKSTKNWVTLIVALVTMALAIGLWPTGKSAPKEEETPASQPAAKANTDKTTPEASAPSESSTQPSAE